MKKLISITSIIFCLLILNACQSRLLTVYKIDIQQGNALEAGTVAKVQTGMSKEQVSFLLGSPILRDSFHPDRWDYIYHFTPGYGQQERRQLILFFDRDEVVEIVKQNIVADDSITDEDNTAPEEEKINTAENQEQESDLTEDEEQALEDQAENL